MDWKDPVLKNCIAAFSPYRFETGHGWYWERVLYQPPVPGHPMILTLALQDGQGHVMIGRTVDPSRKPWQRSAN